MALALATGNLEYVTGIEAEVGGQPLQFVVRLHALHRQPARLGIAQMPRPAGEVLKGAEGARGDAVEGFRRLERLEAAVHDSEVGQFQLQLNLRQESGFFTIGRADEK